MIVTFIGHRKLQFDNGFRQQLKELILSLIDDRNADTFLFGSRSDFNNLCLEVVTEKPNTPTSTKTTKTIYSDLTMPLISRRMSSTQAKRLMSNAISI